MNYRLTTILLAAALLVVLGVTTIRAAPADSPKLADAGDYDYGTHGTDWVPQTPTKTIFTYVAFGANVRAATAGSYWVHTPVPYPTRIANSLMNIKFVEFCAQSTNGAGTKPVRMDLWDYSGKWDQVPIAWPADNAKHCFTYTLPVPSFHQGLGISLNLSFANTVDRIYLFKAWVRLTP